MGWCALSVSKSKPGQKWSKSFYSKTFFCILKIEKNPVFSRIDHFRSPKLFFLAFGWKKMDFKKWKNGVFFVFSVKKDPNWSPRSHYARKWGRCQNTAFSVNIWGKIEHLTLVHFWPTFESDTPRWNFEILGKKCIFLMRKTLMNSPHYQMACFDILVGF